jgi:hypothetical protein
MSPDEKSAQYLDLNVDERLLEIQAEIVEIEKKRLEEKMSEKEKEQSKERIKFLVMEERIIRESRYMEQKDIKQGENRNRATDQVREKEIKIEQEESLFTEKSNTEEIKDILKKEIAEDEKIEGELKEIILATKERKWYETWWGKIVIIIAGTLLLSLLTSEPINFSNIIS